MPLPSIQPRTRWNGGKPSVVVFDVNETLIDIEALSPLFERVFGDRHVLREWFGHLVLYSMTTTLCGLYEDYVSLGRGLFEMVGAVHGVAVEAADVEALRKGMLTMPAHPDAEEGLSELKRAGFRLVTLTNSPPIPTGRALWSMPAWPAISSANSASKRPGLSSRRRSCIAWWPRNWEWRLPPAAWWRPTSGTRSGPRASVSRPA
jgi:haloacid dehalogenase-like hydrolase